MACRLFGAKPLPEPMLTYCQLDPREQFSVKFGTNYKNWINKKAFENVVCESVDILSGGDELSATPLKEVLLPRSLQWCHNGHDGVSNHQPHHCLLNRLFGRRSKKTSKLRVTGLCAGNSPGTGEFPAQMASNAKNVSIWWLNHDCVCDHLSSYIGFLLWINRTRTRYANTNSWSLYHMLSSYHWLLSGWCPLTHVMIKNRGHRDKSAVNE